MDKGRAWIIQPHWPGQILDTHLHASRYAHYLSRYTLDRDALASEHTKNFRAVRVDPESIPPASTKGPAYHQRVPFATNESGVSELNLPHASAFLTRRVALRHNASKSNSYSLCIFCLHGEKPSR